MNLHTVTITGADDSTDINELVALSAVFPFVEWGKRSIAAKSLVRFKQKVRELTGRTLGISIEQMTKELTNYLRDTSASARRLQCWRNWINGYGVGSVIGFCANEA
jgi:hypothetical protein